MTSAARLLGSAALLLAVAEGFRTWTPPTAQCTSTTAVSAASPAGDDAAAGVSRRALGGQAARAAATAAGGLWALGLAGNTGVALAETTPAGVPYKVLKAGSGAQAKVGDLVAIRFRGSVDGKVFDDIFNTEEPYYVRVGSESLVKGIQDALAQMKVRGGAAVRTRIAPPRSPLDDGGRGGVERTPLSSPPDHRWRGQFVSPRARDARASGAPSRRRRRRDTSSGRVSDDARLFLLPPRSARGRAGSLSPVSSAAGRGRRSATCGS